LESFLTTNTYYYYCRLGDLYSFKLKKISSILTNSIPIISAETPETSCLLFLDKVAIDEYIKTKKDFMVFDTIKGLEINISKNDPTCSDWLLTTFQIMFIRSYQSKYFVTSSSFTEIPHDKQTIIAGEKINKPIEKENTPTSRNVTYVNTENFVNLKKDSNGEYIKRGKYPVKLEKTDKTNYKISQNGLNFIKNEEDFRANSYHDGSQRSIGFGTNISYNKYGEPITEEQGEEILILYLEKNIYPLLKTKLKVDLTQNQFDTCCSYGYNRGAGNLKKSIDLINNNETDIEKIFPNTSKVNLISRRIHERNLYSV